VWSTVFEGDDSAPELVDEGLRHAEEAMQELRDLVHGVLPSVLTIGGLRAAVESLASRVSIPISFDVCADRLAPAVEATAYFVTAEALTNLEKHARAESAQVRASLEGDMLRVEVHDDSVGGAHLQASSGLLGLQDRVESLDGRLELHSPAGEGTVIVATLPAARVRVADGTPPELVEVSAPNANGAVPQGPWRARSTSRSDAVGAAPAAYARAATAARRRRRAGRRSPAPSGRCGAATHELPEAVEPVIAASEHLR
jgi:hypothetical protein